MTLPIGGGKWRLSPSSSPDGKAKREAPDAGEQPPPHREFRPASGPTATNVMKDDAVSDDDMDTDEDEAPAPPSPEHVVGLLRAMRVDACNHPAHANLVGHVYDALEAMVTTRADCLVLTTCHFRSLHAMTYETDEQLSSPWRSAMELLDSGGCAPRIITFPPGWERVPFLPASTVKVQLLNPSGAPEALIGGSAFIDVIETNASVMPPATMRGYIVKQVYIEPRLLDGFVHLYEEIDKDVSSGALSTELGSSLRQTLHAFWLCATSPAPAVLDLTACSDESMQVACEKGLVSAAAKELAVAAGIAYITVKISPQSGGAQGSLPEGLAGVLKALRDQDMCPATVPLVMPADQPSLQELRELYGHLAGLHNEVMRIAPGPEACTRIMELLDEASRIEGILREIRSHKNRDYVVGLRMQLNVDIFAPLLELQLKYWLAEHPRDARRADELALLTQLTQLHLAARRYKVEEACEHMRTLLELLPCDLATVREGTSILRALTDRLAFAHPGDIGIALSCLEIVLPYEKGLALDQLAQAFRKWAGTIVSRNLMPNYWKRLERLRVALVTRYLTLGDFHKACEFGKATSLGGGEQEAADLLKNMHFDNNLARLGAWVAAIKAEQHFRRSDPNFADKTTDFLLSAVRTIDVPPASTKPAPRWVAESALLHVQGLKVLIEALRGPAPTDKELKKADYDYGPLAGPREDLYWQCSAFLSQIVMDLLGPSVPALKYAPAEKGPNDLMTDFRQSLKSKDFQGATEHLLMYLAKLDGDSKIDLQEWQLLGDFTVSIRNSPDKETKDTAAQAILRALRDRLLLKTTHQLRETRFRSGREWSLNSAVDYDDFKTVRKKLVDPGFDHLYAVCMATEFMWLPRWCWKNLHMPTVTGLVRDMLDKLRGMGPNADALKAYMCACVLSYLKEILYIDVWGWHLTPENVTSVLSLFELGKHLTVEGNPMTLEYLENQVRVLIEPGATRVLI